MSQESLTSKSNLTLSDTEIAAKKEFYQLASSASKWIEQSVTGGKYMNADEQQRIKIALQILEIAYKNN